MRKFLLVLTTAGAALGANPAAAQAPDAAAQPVATAADAKPAFDLSAGVTAVTDYRFRGISQSNKRPAVQGTVGISHESGFYVGVWSSSISNYVASASPAEVDLYGGYKVTSGGTSIDVGLLYYLYPDSDGATTNFFEPYANISHAVGPATIKLGANAAWKQNGLSLGAGKKSGIYTYGELSVPAVGVPLTITGHVGHSFEKNYITFGTEYTDWSLNAAYVAGPVTLSVGYVDTDKDLFSYPGGGGKNRNVSKAGVVGSVALAF